LSLWFDELETCGGISEMGHLVRIMSLKDALSETGTCRLVKLEEMNNRGKSIHGLNSFRNEVFVKPGVLEPKFSDFT
jgi:hypothetical protein